MLGRTTDDNSRLRKAQSDPNTTIGLMCWVIWHLHVWLLTLFACICSTFASRIAAVPSGSGPLNQLTDAADPAFWFLPGPTVMFLCRFLISLCPSARDNSQPAACHTEFLLGRLIDLNLCFSRLGMISWNNKCNRLLARHYLGQMPGLSYKREFGIKILIKSGCPDIKYYMSRFLSWIADSTLLTADSCRPVLAPVCFDREADNSMRCCLIIIYLRGCQTVQ